MTTDQARPMQRLGRTYVRMLGRMMISAAVVLSGVVSTGASPSFVAVRTQPRFWIAMALTVLMGLLLIGVAKKPAESEVRL